MVDKCICEFENLVNKQLERIKIMKENVEIINIKTKNPIVIGVCGGDGIGPIIMKQAEKILNLLLQKEIERNKIIIRNIEGLTLERRLEEQVPIPREILKQIKECDVILKGPTTTPRKADNYLNIESANVALRKELDLFANVRPIKIPDEGIDWTFFRENTEGSYALGNQGINVTDDLSIDFTITTSQGTERIIRAAFEYAKANKKKRVTAVTKANVIKTTDGKFLDIFYNIAKEYKDIDADDWYIDIMTAKLIDKKRRSEFQVFVLPNLYGDIITDEAAEIKGGVGTAGSANIGMRYAMFEAIHGSAPRMLEDGREKYADPTSIFKATVMLLNYIGYEDKAKKLDRVLEKCLNDKKYKITGRSNGLTNEELTNILLKDLRW